MYLLNAQNGPTAIPFHCSGLDVLIVLNLRFTDYRFVGSDADIGRLVIALNVLCQRGNGRRVGHFEMQQLPGDGIRSIGASSSTLPSGIHSVFLNVASAVAVSMPETCNALQVLKNCRTQHHLRESVTQIFNLKQCTSSMFEIASLLCVPTVEVERVEMQVDFNGNSETQDVRAYLPLPPPSPSVSSSHIYSGCSPRLGSQLLMKRGS